MTHASYEPITSDIAGGGPRLEVNADGEPVNMQTLIASLDEAGADTFNQSLSWFGTESQLPLTSLDGKTAKEVVDLVNCLKASTGGADSCLEQ